MWKSFLKYPGPSLKELVLPKGIKKVGRYAFYNCRNLEKLDFGGKLKDLGAGALTGCHQVQELRVKLGRTWRILSEGRYLPEDFRKLFVLQ